VRPYNFPMKQFLRLFPVVLMLGLLGTVPRPVWAEDTQFISAIEDLPLMAGLVEDTDSALVFDSSGGRYVEAFADGALTSKDVTVFYKATLPQLGWQKTGGMTDFTFEREDETLMLEITNKADTAGMIRVRFVLSPKK
jgi:hypothetical protein